MERPTLSDYFISEQDLIQIMDHLADDRSRSGTLLAFADKIEFEPEQVLIHEGDSDAAVFILSEGTLEVTIEDDGRQRTVATIEPFALFGEQSFIDGGKRTATVFARTAGVAHRLTDSGFDQLASVHPDAACAFLRDVSRALAGRIRQMTR